MRRPIEGIFVPVVTPFQEQKESLDIGMLKSNIEKLNDSGVAGYMALGSNGEAVMMTDEEALKVVKTVKKEASIEKLVFAGTGRESLKHTVEFTKRAVEIGVDAVFVLPPHYFPKQMSQECLEQYYMKVADYSEVPVILYQAPGFASGVTLKPETVKKLSEHSNIVGMKDTYGEAIQEYTSIISEGFAFLSGSFGKFAEGMKLGAAGGVLSCANYIPDLCVLLYEMMKNKDEYAEVLYENIQKMLIETTAYYGVAGVKMAMNYLGYFGGITRSPLLYPSKDTEKVMGERLTEWIDMIRRETTECR